MGFQSFEDKPLKVGRDISYHFVVKFLESTTVT